MTVPSAMPIMNDKEIFISWNRKAVPTVGSMQWNISIMVCAGSGSKKIKNIQEE